jgi:hypothetical protein
MKPADPRQRKAGSHIVESADVNAQHALPEPHWADVEQLKDAPIEQVWPAAMQVACAPRPGTT